jgi:hypothetical protein
MLIFNNGGFMKRKNLLALMVCMVSLSGMASTPVETLVPVDHIYSPKGFDSNDNTEVIVEGRLPNLCHKAPWSKIEVKPGKVEITLSALKYEDNSPFCVPVEVPFVHPVSLGLLNKGNYEIVVNGKSMWEQKGDISISESQSPAADDFIYANVAFVEKEEGSRMVKLKGYTPSDCLSWDEVKFVSNGVDTLAVLPKMKQIYSHCPMKMVPFEKEVEIPRVLDRNKILLHVRVMDGKSVNTLFENN